MSLPFAPCHALIKDDDVQMNPRCEQVIAARHSLNHEVANAAGDGYRQRRVCC
jgi:hypothetical protein